MDRPLLRRGFFYACLESLAEQGTCPQLWCQMANTVKLKRSAVEGKVPQVADLELGELALNTFDGKAYIKKSANGTDSIVEIGSIVSSPPILTTAKVISQDVVGDPGEHMMSIHDVTVASGYTVEVPTGSVWVIVD